MPSLDTGFLFCEHVSHLGASMTYTCPPRFPDPVATMEIRDRLARNEVILHPMYKGPDAPNVHICQGVYLPVRRHEVRGLCALLHAAQSQLRGSGKIGHQSMFVPSGA
ncbi:hypothetical protein HBI42_037550 [Parastagonospora nodorum]|nr:hypothetical protein HBI43_042990 [Parastagonospora nodorum]KAH6269825.1 hypothetical protein HBI42_037550 [Parastagonospora nodorum]